MPQVPVTEQIKMQIEKAKESENNEISVELNPASLGKVNIRIETINEKTQIHITAQKPETLFMLQQDAKNLESKLNEIGIKINDTQLSFNLSQNSSDHQRNQRFFDQNYQKDKVKSSDENFVIENYYPKRSDLSDQLDIII